MFQVLICFGSKTVNSWYQEWNSRKIICGKNRLKWEMSKFFHKISDTFLRVTFCFPVRTILMKSIYSFHKTNTVLSDLNVINFLQLIVKHISSNSVNIYEN
jgi:hypothetical protein